MFGRQPPVIIHDTRTEYVTKDVHVHRAPTDKSVELLREMETAARKEVDKAVSVQNTEFACVVHRAHDQMSDSVKLKALFKLNGKPFSATVEKQRNAGDTPQDEFARLRDEVAKVIAGEVLHAAFVGEMRNRFK